MENEASAPLRAKLFSMMFFKNQIFPSCQNVFLSGYWLMGIFFNGKRKLTLSIAALLLAL